jgi:hypothetical protein
MLKLGAIKNFPLKDLWTGEATHFTPWLSQNLDVLAMVELMQIRKNFRKFGNGQSQAY